MRGIVLILLLSAAPALAEEDPFFRLSGTFGRPFTADSDCQTNPHTVRFLQGNHRARFEWPNLVEDYEGKPRVFAEYSVQGLDGNGIIMALDGESRLTEAGEPVVWIMRPVARPDGYCWGRTDWPAARCIAVTLRCKGDAPSS